MPELSSVQFGFGIKLYLLPSFYGDGDDAKRARFIGLHNTSRALQFRTDVHFVHTTSQTLSNLLVLFNLSVTIASFNHYPH
jgi:hypothetical protein